jgi:hypothetical protein
MFYVTDGAQFTFVTFIANTFAFFTVTVIPTVIWACFVLATFTSPVCVTQASTIDTLTLSFLFVTVQWTFLVFTINTHV